MNRFCYIRRRKLSLNIFPSINLITLTQGICYDTTKAFFTVQLILALIRPEDLSNLLALESAKFK